MELSAIRQKRKSIFSQHNTHQHHEKRSKSQCPSLRRLKRKASKQRVIEVPSFTRAMGNGIYMIATRCHDNDDSPKLPIPLEQGA